MKLEKMEVVGLKELEKKMLRDLPAATSRKVTLAAMKEAAKPMVDGAQSKADRGRSGALAESIGTKTVTVGRTLGAKGNSFASITLGPRSGVMTAWARYLSYYQRGISAISQGAASTSEIGRIRHGHLVEFGFRHKSGKHVPPKPFLRPAFDVHAGDFLRFFRGHLKNKIEAAARKKV